MPANGLIVAQTGEQVLSREQTRALASMMDDLPRFHSGGMVGGSALRAPANDVSGTRSGAGEIRINIYGSTDPEATARMVGQEVSRQLDRREPQTINRAVNLSVAQSRDEAVRANIRGGSRFGNIRGRR